jgi:urea transporter
MIKSLVAICFAIAAAQLLCMVGKVLCQFYFKLMEENRLTSFFFDFILWPVISGISAYASIYIGAIVMTWFKTTPTLLMVIIVGVSITMPLKTQIKIAYSERSKSVIQSQWLGLITNIIGIIVGGVHVL